MNRSPRFPQPLVLLCLTLAFAPPLLSCAQKAGGGAGAGFKENGLHSYALSHGGKYRAGMALYKELSAALEGRGLEDCDFALAVVFPEMLRYSPARNLLEFLATKLVYSLSPSFGGCTIGHFQMKVSFAETVERYVMLSPELQAKYPAIDFRGGNKTLAERSRRVGRINGMKGESDYLYAFIDICTQKFALEDLDDEGRLVLLAAAYNAGMSRTREELEQVLAVNSYPNGLNSPKSKWSYAAIALEFYRGRKEGGRD